MLLPSTCPSVSRIETKDPTGRVYYFNKKTNEASWSLPAGAVSIKHVDATPSAATAAGARRRSLMSVGSEQGESGDAAVHPPLDPHPGKEGGGAATGTGSRRRLMQAEGGGEEVTVEQAPEGGLTEEGAASFDLFKDDAEFWDVRLLMEDPSFAKLSCPRVDTGNLLFMNPLLFAPSAASGRRGRGQRRSWRRRRR